ncbi:hypothetical protein [Mycobacterium sp.]|uniref:hypothetical protein n=1 Tax=Mycobacterium sp. TaxID=1785 RepID=UPI003BAA6481
MSLFEFPEVRVAIVQKIRCVGTAQQFTYFSVQNISSLKEFHRILKFSRMICNEPKTCDAVGFERL